MLVSPQHMVNTSVTGPLQERGEGVLGVIQLKKAVLLLRSSSRIKGFFPNVATNFCNVWTMILPSCMSPEIQDHLSSNTYQSANIAKDIFLKNLFVDPPFSNIMTMKERAHFHKFFREIEQFDVIRPQFMWMVMTCLQYN